MNCIATRLNLLYLIRKIFFHSSQIVRPGFRRLFVLLLLLLFLNISPQHISMNHEKCKTIRNELEYVFFFSEILRRRLKVIDKAKTITKILFVRFSYIK